MLTDRNHRDDSFIRLPLHEPSSFRGLSFLSKCVAAYIRTLVDSQYGWLALRGKDVDLAFRHSASGTFTRADTRLFKRCIEQLVEQGFLVRCRVTAADPGTLPTQHGREVALSSWLEDPEGDWVVIADWVPEQLGLCRHDKQAWHAARRERIAVTSEQQPLDDEQAAAVGDPATNRLHGIVAGHQQSEYVGEL